MYVLQRGSVDTQFSGSRSTLMHRLQNRLRRVHPTIGLQSALVTGCSAGFARWRSKKCDHEIGRRMPHLAIGVIRRGIGAIMGESEEPSQEELLRGVCFGVAYECTTWHDVWSTAGSAPADNMAIDRQLVSCAASFASTSSQPLSSTGATWFHCGNPSALTCSDAHHVYFDLF
ncbi:hypothetical protein Y032_0022g556 [Ancylostoma ceylanicum]|uniref:Uncharacterized protein n=1 Tax=Ancylostoma ceylanicum TaxID=53326 RepID=A0A016UXZ3_9BILA|nr:hypothetical protein Y032_0022g556 [Ancylostoma ceylanicum]